MREPVTSPSHRINPSYSLRLLPAILPLFVSIRSARREQRAVRSTLQERSHPASPSPAPIVSLCIHRSQLHARPGPIAAATEPNEFLPPFFDSSTGSPPPLRSLLQHLSTSPVAYCSTEVFTEKIKEKNKGEEGKEKKKKGEEKKKRREERKEREKKRKKKGEKKNRSAYALAGVLAAAGDRRRHDTIVSS